MGPLWEPMGKGYLRPGVRGGGTPYVPSQKPMLG
jgi:hypothetical protein